MNDEPESPKCICYAVGEGMKCPGKGHLEMYNRILNNNTITYMCRFSGDNFSWETLLVQSDYVIPHKNCPYWKNTKELQGMYNYVELMRNL